MPPHSPPASAQSPPGCLVLLVTALLSGLPQPLPARAAAVPPQVVAVPSRPAFVRPPGRLERRAEAGLTLLPETLLRTQTPGRMQVRLADGRSFRLGGDTLLRLGRGVLELERGQIIAWIAPQARDRSPLQVRTRVATASIEGTTVFLEVNDHQVRVFSWEGRVRLTTTDGRSLSLDGGEELLFAAGVWQPLRRLSPREVRSRLSRSILLNDFAAPMETLPLIRSTLERPAQPGMQPP